MNKSDKDLNRPHPEPGRDAHRQERQEGSFLRLEHWQLIRLFLIAYDIVAVSISYVAALWLRYDFVYSRIPKKYIVSWARFCPFYAAFCIAVFVVLKMYRSVWRYASDSELIRVFVSSIITSIFHTVFITVFMQRMPISYYMAGALLQFILVLGIRFSYRFVLFLRNTGRTDLGDSKVKRVMLIGAGSAGRMILRDIARSEELTDKVVCIIDDSSNKWNRYIDGIPVVGGRDDILANVKKYRVDKIFLAIPSATASERRDILEICKETGCELKNLPGMYQFVRGDITVSNMKNVSVEDLLGREPIKADMTEVFEFINGKTVLVTGGGGSIGSELCRQIAAHDPGMLIIFDIYENNAYDIQLELREKYPELNLVTLIGSVRDSRKIFKVFKTYHPQIVYHAAAHKHVPLMEDSPCEAVKNNAIGTYKTAYAAMVTAASGLC